MTSINDDSERSPLLPPAPDHSKEISGYEASVAGSSVESAARSDASFRWRSINICHLTFFISSLGFSICLPSIWPYLQQVDDQADEAFLGWVIAAFSVGQLLASPILGFLSDKMKQAKMPLLIGQGFGLLGSLVYSYVHLFPSNRRYVLLVSRLIIGLGAGNGAVIRSFVSGATTLEERTPVMAVVSIAQAFGFIVGPAVQAVFTFLGYPGFLHEQWLTIDMYTSAGLLSIILGVFNTIIIVMFFKEFFFEVREGQPNNSSNINSSLLESEESRPRPDSLAASVCIAAFCVLFFNFSILETIMTPMSQIMFAWNKEQASLYNGLALAVCGLISLFSFASIKAWVKMSAAL